jgi:hypothetical protein
MLLQEEDEDAYPGFTVLYLLFREQNSVFLLLGRRQDAEAGTSEEGSSSATAKTGKEKEGSADGDDEKDDDSPYFVKITLD